jgi:hypothetical protein
MPTHWGWVKDASYAGKHTIGDRTYDQWRWRNAGVTLTVSVSETHADRPYYFSRVSSTENFEIHFITFETRKPNASWFDVPDVCKNKTGIDISEFTRVKKDVPQILLGPLNGICPTAIESAIQIAKSDCPYAFGGIGPCATGFDNDGFVAKAFADGGRLIPRDVDEQQAGGDGCVGGVRPGDLLFVGSPAYHVAMALGNGMIAECPWSGERCHITTLDESRFDGGCRRYC